MCIGILHATCMYRIYFLSCCELRESWGTCTLLSSGRGTRRRWVQALLGSRVPLASLRPRSTGASMNNTPQRTLVSRGGQKSILQPYPWGHQNFSSCVVLECNKGDFILKVQVVKLFPVSVLLLKYNRRFVNNWSACQGQTGSNRKHAELW